MKKPLSLAIATAVMACSMTAFADSRSPGVTAISDPVYIFAQVYDQTNFAATFAVLPDIQAIKQAPAGSKPIVKSQHLGAAGGRTAPFLARDGYQNWRSTDTTRNV